jgi:hypothetical protein
MSRTDNLSIVASLLGFLLAVYSIFTQPVVVQSARPTQTGSGEPTRSDVPAYARLWDDPFAVYSDIYIPLPPNPQLLRDRQKTLFLVIPTKTFAYEEDKENRLRIRYAVQRALFDHGFVARSGNLISTIDLTPADENENTPAVSVRSADSRPGTTDDAPDRNKTSAPIQTSAPVEIFSRSAWPNDQGAGPRDGFSAVAIVWLPDSYIWTADRTEPCSVNLWSALRAIKTRLAGPEDHGDEWVFLGPSDSDALAFFEQHSRPLDSLPMKLSVVPYRATIAKPLLDRIVDRYSPFSLAADLKPNSQGPGASELARTFGPTEARPADPRIIRFPNGDDVLCLELLRAVRHHSISLLPAKPLRVLVLAEWDTLYGRGLAETFTALASRGNSPEAHSHDTYHQLTDCLASQPGTEDLLNGLPASATIEVRVLPYLRGLDGASTLYRKAYAQSVLGDSGKSSMKAGDGSAQPARLGIEAAEGTTQFDYIRRLIETDYKQHAPFFQRSARPDAVIIFGTDVYDKLALLEFLRQELRNPLYLTTDLDALYWHPHYLKFTKNLVVASPFPLRMNRLRTSVKEAQPGKPPDGIMKSVAFRDIHQSAVYLAVCRCLDSQQIGSTTFKPNDWPRLYRVGNSRPLPIRFAGEPASKHSPATFGLRSLDEIWMALAEGVSICCSLAFQAGAILLGLFAVFIDIPSRVSLGQAVSDEVWSSALLGLSDTTRARIERLRSRLRTKWLEIRQRRLFSWWSKPNIEQPVLSPVNVCLSRMTEEELNRHLDAFEEQIAKAVCQAQIASLALRLLATLFCIQRAKEQKRPKSTEFLIPGRLRGFLARYSTYLTIWLARSSPTGSLRKLARKILADRPQPQSNPARIYLGLEITPFAKFAARTLSMKPDLVEIYPKLQPVWQFVMKPARWLDRRLPTWHFAVGGVILLLLVIAICSAPTAYLLGPETLSTFWRTVRWLVETLALLVICAVFHRVCYEHYRFRELTRELVPLINERVALSNRQLVVLLAQASTQIANLALTPAALLFLIYLSHFPFLGGAPLTFEMLCLLLTPLGILAYSYARVRGAALGAAEEVKSAYNREASDADRFIVRLQSYVKGDRPLQDDEVSLEGDLQKLIENSSTSDAPDKLRPGDLRSAAIRNQCIAYLNALRNRNRAFVESLAGVRDGLFAPLIANPIIAALVIPLGGASGLNLIQWLVSFVR